MIAGSTFTNIFGMVPAGDDRIAKVARAAVAAGLAIVVCRPDTRIPTCTLAPAAAKRADIAAQQSARVSGHPQPEKVRHACGIAHAITDPAKVAPVITRLTRVFGQAPNIGVELGLSRMIVVDVDTSAERAGFLTDWSVATGADQTHRTPTVESPGQRTPAGEWVHRGGGHWWFTVPDDIELPAGTGVLKAPSGWTAMWAGRQVIVPPSSRPEGVYRLVGQVPDAPAWLTDMIYQEVDARRVRKTLQVDRVLDSDSDIERWSALTPWADLLQPDGWTDTGLVDTCGCPVWTAPGDHASPKSATAHEPGCARFDTSTGWGPLHIWTSTAPDWLAGRSTVTKVQYVALRDHMGSDSAALRALGLIPAPAGLDTFDPRQVLDHPSQTEQGTAHPDQSVDPFSCATVPTDSESVGIDQKESESDALPDDVSTFLSRMLDSDALDGLADPEPLVSGVLDRDTLARMVGKPGSGKTFVGLDIAASIATGRAWHGRPVHQGLVVYLAAEGVRGLKKRIRAWESTYRAGERVPAGGLLIIPFPVQVADAAQWTVMRQALRHLGPVLVVLDTQARITVGVDENSATDMGAVVERLEQIRRDTGACVLVVHHLGHQGDQGRGSSAVLGAVHTELRVTRDATGRVTLYCDKQKDDAQFEPFVFDTVTVHDSAVLMPVGGDADPFDAAGTVGPESPAVRRVALCLRQVYPRRGATKAELRSSVQRRDIGPRGRPMSNDSFYRAWDELTANGQFVQVVLDGKATARYVVAPELVDLWGLDRSPAPAPLDAAASISSDGSVPDKT